MPEPALPAVPVEGRFWRILAPRWAHAPLSGEGAARHGGRFNEPAVPALYISRDLMTAVAEYLQDLGCRPGTFCAYEVEVEGVVDLGDRKVLHQLGLSAADLRCPWKRIALIDKKRPPTWNLAKDLAARGFAGVLVPSVPCPIQGTNLVLWRWNDSASRKVRALDPNSDLPRDQRSWR